MDPITEQIVRMGHAFDWWVGVIAGLPFPFVVAFLVLGILYVLEKN